MKVTFCAYDRPGYVGGPNAGLRRLLPDLRQKGIDARALFLVFGNDDSQLQTVQALREQGVPCRLARYQKSTPQRVRWLLRALCEEPPDIFVPNLMPAAYFASRWLHKAGIPTVGVLRSDDEFHYGLLDVFARKRDAFRQSAWVCVSSFLAEAARSAAGHGVPVTTIPSSIDLPGERIRRQGGPLRIVYTGRLVERQKRICDVIRILANITRNIPDTEALIYGDGPDKTKAEDTLRQENVGGKVRLMGRIDSDLIQRELLSAHIFIMKSDYEGMPVSLMEAMAVGLVPVCGYTRSGIPELVQDGETGILINGNDDDFISAIYRLKNDPDLLDRLSRQAQKHIAERYSRNHCADHWAEFLHNLHNTASPKTKIRPPFMLSLPPVHQGIAREDDRIPLLEQIQAFTKQYCGIGDKNA